MHDTIQLPSPPPPQKKIVILHYSGDIATIQAELHDLARLTKITKF